MAKLTIPELLEAIKELTVLELNELVKAAEEKTEFDVELTEVGSEKIKVIKVVRELTGLGLKEAKELVDNAPKVLKEAAPKAEADSIVAKLAEIGAKATLK